MYVRLNLTVSTQQAYWPNTDRIGAGWIHRGVNFLSGTLKKFFLIHLTIF